eukprot:scaffold189335_cov36-Tisochrysis_lutea.AAC.1
MPTSILIAPTDAMSSGVAAVYTRKVSSCTAFDPYERDRVTRLVGFLNLLELERKFGVPTHLPWVRGEIAWLGKRASDACTVPTLQLPLRTALKTTAPPWAQAGISIRTSSLTSEFKPDPRVLEPPAPRRVHMHHALDCILRPIKELLRRLVSQLDRNCPARLSVGEAYPQLDPGPEERLGRPA